ncbi:MAG: OmpA family protein, partial [Paludibacteraceae bacterium]|nr:OmpA family protein [Paludibacteraceae bacterium]
VIRSADDIEGDSVMLYPAHLPHLLYNLNRTYVNPSLGDNRAMLDHVVSLLTDLRQSDTLRIACVRITGHASIDGREAHNRELAGQRADSLADWLQRHADLSGLLLDVRGEGEAWSRLEQQLDLTIERDPQNPHAGELSRARTIVRSSAPRQQRYDALRRIRAGRTFAYLLDSILPDQRSAYITIYVTPQADPLPATVNRANQLLRDGQHAQAYDLMQGVADDARTWNTLGVAAYYNGQYDTALDYFRRAAQAGSPQALHNLNGLQQLIGRGSNTE